MTTTPRRLLHDGAPGMNDAWRALNAAVFEAPTAIPRKYKELIALGVALTTQCPGCLRGHVNAAIAAGATQEEIAEATHVAAALRGGGAMSHGAEFLMAPFASKD